MKIILIASFLFGVQILYSQNVINSSGGDIMNANGSTSFSIGQIFYESSVGKNGQVNQGVQHSIELFALSNVKLETVTLKATTFPNPTKDNILLNIQIADLNNFSYQLFNVKGQKIGSEKIKNENTNISLNNVYAGIYILKVLQKNNQLKTFKIIKQ